MAGSPYGPKADAGPPGLAAKLLGFCEELRSEGVAVGTSEILDAFAALDQVPWTAQEDFREALAATIAKSQEDRRVFELLFERYFFRAAEAEAIERRDRRGGAQRHEGGERLDIDELREQIRQAIIDGDEDEMRDLARLAIAAFGRQGEGSGVVGVDVQRIRRTLGSDAPGHSPPPRPAPSRRGDRPRPAEPLRAPPSPRAGTRPDRAHRPPCPPPAPSPSSTAPCPPARPRTWPPSIAPSRR